MNTERILIEVKDNYRIYGRVIGNSGRLGKFEIIHFGKGRDDFYYTYADVEKEVKRRIESSKKEKERTS